MSANEQKSSKKRWFILIAIFTIYTLGMVCLIQSSLRQPITLDQSAELKKLMKENLALEREKGTSIDYETVWNKLLELEGIKEKALPSEFEEFTRAQYKDVKKYLEGQISQSKIQIYNNKKDN